GTDSRNLPAITERAARFDTGVSNYPFRLPHLKGPIPMHSSSWSYLTYAAMLQVTSRKQFGPEKKARSPGRTEDQCHHIWKIRHIGAPTLWGQKISALTANHSWRVASLRTGMKSKKLKRRQQRSLWLREYPFHSNAWRSLSLSSICKPLKACSSSSLSSSVTSPSALCRSAIAERAAVIRDRMVKSSVSRT